LQKGIEIYAQAIQEGTSSAREEFRETDMQTKVRALVVLAVVVQAILLYQKNRATIRPSRS
jgi:hypothetical protein